MSQRERKEGRKEAKDGVGSGEGEVQREAYGTPPFLNARGDGYVGFSTLFALFFLGWLVSSVVVVVLLVCCFVVCGCFCLLSFFLVTFYGATWWFLMRNEEERRKNRSGSRNGVCRWG